LKIGYVSSDLRGHVVGWNLLPFMRCHDHQGFEIFCYHSAVHGQDKLTRQLRQASDHWREVTFLDDRRLAEQIRADGIDVLVDLSLHTANNRLVTFAMEPAPVQITYLAYCGTSGVQAMHYRFSDPHLDPPGQDLSCYSEQTVRLPRTYWCYEPGGAAPEVSALPANQNGFVTFGCMNQFAKVSTATLEVWGRVLARVPGSRLLMYASPGKHLEAIENQFRRNGIASDRVQFIGRQGWDQYIRTYHRIDVALDPFPYNGGITTCDTLWMGVPVVTLSGPTAVGRAGRSILSNVGLAELVARDAEQYVQIAADLAADPTRLADLRRSIRQRMKASPLMDAKQFAADIESAYRRLWRTWCLKRA
jgi:predicted O-linked N-acetylglucosamine transferase (SPINDLY family)